MKKIILSLCTAMLVVSYAETYNKIDKQYKREDVEHGLHFYDENKEDEKVKITKEDALVENPKMSKKPDTNELLTQIVILLQQQKEELRELKEIKKAINPNEPRMIQNEKGEMCLSNSSVDCFDIPVIQEGRNVPVLHDFIKEPNEQTAKKWLLYQAKLFNHYMNMGYSLKFAALNGDEKDYPVNALNIYGSPKENITAELYRDKILEILDSKKSELGTMIFLGKSKRIEEHWGKDSVAMTAFRKGKFFNIALVFDSNETKKEYDEHYKNMYDKQLVEVYSSLPKIVSNDLFNKFKITLTPTAVAYYKTKDKEISSVIERGYITQLNLTHNYQHFLVYNKIVEPSEFHSAKIWNANIEEKLNEK
ncbi:hypothetical protein ACOL23_09715 [Aliarcobacter butzleri]